MNNERLEKWSRDLWDTESETPRATIKDQPAWLVLSWAQPVRLRGLAALWAGFGAAEVQALAAATQAPALEATDADWQAVSSWTGVDTQYPRQLAVNWLDFGRDVTTRAVRLRITEVAKVNHPHLNTATKNGQRVWLGELMALHSLGGEPLASAVLPVEQTELPHPPIPIRFSLPRAGLVTLVIEDATGLRIRNLVSETPFPAGENTAWWDGLDDLGRDPEAAKHGIYSVPGKPVKPGRYRVRGLAHDELALRYEFPIYTAGNPAWNTADNTGAWLANHTPPSAAVFLPADRSPDGQPRVYLGSFVSEGTHGLAWVDLDGKKLGGEKWVGGVWTGAPFLARDDGRERAAEHLAYVASVWTSGKGTTDAELRLTALTAKDDLAVYRETWPLPAKNPKDNQLAAEISGLAVQDGVIVVALKRLQKLVFVNARTKQRLGEHELRDSRGLAFDPQGRLLALSGNRLLRFAFNQTGKLGAPAVFIADQLEDPQHLTTDAAGRVYVSDWGRAHQVKVFSADGKFLHAIGKPGVPRGGIYDAQHLNHPAGLTLDSRQQLWVTENDEQPKRVSVWTPEGKFLRAFYGPAEYGGGGFLDSGDPGLFHYSGMTFRLDWQTGRSELIAVPYRVDAARLELGFRNKPPEFALYRQGRRYFSNCYNNNPTGGSSTAFLFVERDHEAVPVAGMGRAKDWNVLQRPEFKPRWPQGIDPLGDPNKNPALFAWSDLNGDGLAQPDEVQILPGQCGGVTVMPDLAFVLSRWEGKAGRFAAQRFTDAGVPVYDLEKRDTIADGVLGPKSSGGDQVLVHSNGWSVVTLGVAPFAPQSLCGVFKGAARWSYPSVWPGLHASHEAAVPDRPGMVIGSTRLLGGFVESKAGPLWCVNGNMGPMYLFTADGLFVQSLFQDVRLGQPWSMPAAQRGMLLNGVSPHDENFFRASARRRTDAFSSRRRAQRPRARGWTRHVAAPARAGDHRDRSRPPQRPAVDGAKRSRAAEVRGPRDARRRMARPRAGGGRQARRLERRAMGRGGQTRDARVVQQRREALRRERRRERRGRPAVRGLPHRRREPPEELRRHAERALQNRRCARRDAWHGRTSRAESRRGRRGRPAPARLHREQKGRRHAVSRGRARHRGGRARAVLLAVADDSLRPRRRRQRATAVRGGRRELRVLDSAEHARLETRRGRGAPGRPWRAAWQRLRDRPARLLEQQGHCHHGGRAERGATHAAALAAGASRNGHDNRVQTAAEESAKARRVSPEQTVGGSPATGCAGVRR